MSKFLKAIVNIVLLVAILSAGALLIPPLLGVTTKVSDGTGNTNLSRGSVTYATSAQATELETGDRILQEDSNGSYIYTVSSIAADTSTYTVTDEVSGNTTDLQLTGGVQKVALTIPVIGMLSLTLQSREGIIILGLCVAFLIILFILSEVWRKDDDEDEDEDEEDDDEAEDDSDEEEEKPLSRKEKRRLKKEARRKAKEAEEEDDEEEDVEEEEQEPVKESTETETEPEQNETLTAAVSEEAAETEEDEMIIRDLEEEPEESTVVDTRNLKAAPIQKEKEEILEALGEAAPKKSIEEEETEALERSLAEAVGELLNEEENETPPADAAAPAKEETENTDNIEETTETDNEESEQTEETEESDSAETGEIQEETTEEEEPIELAIPIHTAEELLQKAEEAGDHPEVIEDKETGVTILDYSDIL